MIPIWLFLAIHAISYYTGLHPGKSRLIVMNRLCQSLKLTKPRAFLFDRSDNILSLVILRTPAPKVLDFSYRDIMNPQKSHKAILPQKPQLQCASDCSMVPKLQGLSTWNSLMFRTFGADLGMVPSFPLSRCYISRRVFERAI